jgi:xanthine dehydrogenase YagS FAD-binding subunit
MITLARTAEEAVAATGEFRAGGTDVQERRRSGIARGALVDIHLLTGYDRIDWRADGAATIGALVTIDAIASDPRIRAAYPGLALAAGGLATPQIRQVGTLGGSLLQRTRCWYFRHPAFNCYKRGGDTCPARTGQHQHGVIFDLGPCVFPHPSTLGMALLAYEAEIEVHGQGWRPAEALFGDGSDPHRDHLLEPGELLTQAALPAPLAGERAAYFRAITRAEAEWPLVEALARLALDDHGTISFARIGVGGVANVPLRLPQVEAALLGQPATAETLERAAARATEGVTSLPLTGYKVALLRGVVLEALERALG